MNDKDLDRCPCCGSKARFDEIATTDGEGDSGGHFIECTHDACKITTQLVFACGEDPKIRLASIWNYRPVNHYSLDPDDLAIGASYDGLQELLRATRVALLDCNEVVMDKDTEIAALQVKVHELEQEKARVTYELQHLDIAHTNIVAELDTLQAKVKELEELSTNYRDCFHRSEAERDTLQAKVNELESIVSAYVSTNDNLRYELRECASELSTTKFSLEVDRDALRQQLESVTARLIECRSSVKLDLNNYERFILRKGAAVNDCDTDEVNRIAALLDYIDSAMKEAP